MKWGPILPGGRMKGDFLYPFLYKSLKKIKNCSSCETELKKLRLKNENQEKKKGHLIIQQLFSHFITRYDIKDPQTLQYIYIPEHQADT